MPEEKERGWFTALTIAGSDSSGGAGIQADLKTFAALNVYGVSAVTAVTAQNTVAVSAVWPVPARGVYAQVEAVLSDIPVNAVKTGMLAEAEIVEAVADSLERFPVPHLVVDPVMVASSGRSLLRESGRDTMRKRLFPLARLVTPNLAEVEALTGIFPRTLRDIEEAGRRILDMGPEWVLLKGGHGEGETITDWLIGREGKQAFTGKRLHGCASHGTGCTLSAAIAAFLARGVSLPDAVYSAREYLVGAMRTGFFPGQGAGILHHLHRVRKGE